MNKLFKSFITLCLLVVATLVFVPSIFAAITGSSTGSITVNDLENGVTVHGYKVIDVNIEDLDKKSWNTEEISNTSNKNINESNQNNN